MTATTSALFGLPRGQRARRSTPLLEPSVRGPTAGFGVGQSRAVATPCADGCGRGMRTECSMAPDLGASRLGALSISASVDAYRRAPSVRHPLNRFRRLERLQRRRAQQAAPTGGDALLRGHRLVGRLDVLVV